MALSLLRNRITFVWLILITATAISWEMGHGIGFDDVRYASMAIILVSFIKVRFVILDFMEIRHAPRFMRLIGEAWVIVVAAVLIVLYWQGVS